MVGIGLDRRNETWRSHKIQINDTQYRDFNQNDTLYDNTQHKNFKHSDTKHNDTQYKWVICGIQLNNTQSNNTLPLCWVLL